MLDLQNAKLLSNVKDEAKLRIYRRLIPGNLV